MTPTHQRNTRVGRTLRPSRVRRGAALAALCALALTACGAERAGGGDAKAATVGAAPARSAAAGPTAEPPVDPADTAGPEFLTFMELLLSVAEPCAGDVPAPDLPGEPEPPRQGGPVPPEPKPVPPEPVPEVPVPVPDEPLPTEKPRPARAATEEAELSAVETCAASHHARRITKALDGTSDPTPSHVEDALRGLGYLDERIHGVRRSGEKVTFVLDLRVMGGQLCLSGSTTGTRTAIEPYGASVEVDCADVRRRG